MSSGPNHRRSHGRITDNGPTWEGGPPCSGCNSTHVARSRSKWKKLRHKHRRRVDKHLLKQIDADQASHKPPRCGAFRKMH